MPDDQHQHELAERLERLVRQQEVFAYGISHDLRAPLRSIESFSGLLAKHSGEQLDETGRDYLDRIRNAASRMSSLLAALADLSHATRAELKPGPVDLSLLADWVLAELQEAEPERTVRTQVQPGLVAQGDERLLKLLLEQLLHNAWKFAQGRGEALHGVAWLGEATVFPQAIGLAGTWNPELVRRVGAVTGREARGFHALDPAFNGLNLWAPVVNPLRDPRWGRNEEGYSEDPHLTGVIATAFGHGVQGDHPDYLQAAPTLKHYAAYNVEDDRITVDSIVPPRVLKDYDEAAFRPAIEADAATGVMASYNLLNGRPTHVSHDLDDVVRSWTDEDLMIVGDAGGASNVAGAQRYYPNEVEGNAAAIRAGLDSFTEDNRDSAPTTTSIKAAIDRGLITVSDVEDAARHVLSVRFRLGEFDPAGRNPYAATTPDVIDAPEHRQLARRVAAEQPADHVEHLA